MKTKTILPFALLILAAGSASAATRYVWQSSPSPGPPHTSWAAAARVIQNAVDAAAPGDQTVVTNGLQFKADRGFHHGEHELTRTESLTTGRSN